MLFLLFIFCVVVFSRKLDDPLLPIIFKNEAIEKPFQRLVTNMGFHLVLKIIGELPALPWKTAKLKRGKFCSEMLTSIPVHPILLDNLDNFFSKELIYLFILQWDNMGPGESTVLDWALLFFPPLLLLHETYYLLHWSSDSKIGSLFSCSPMYLYSGLWLLHQSLLFHFFSIFQKFGEIA